MNKVKLRSFKKGRDFVRKLGLKNRYEWAVYCTVENLCPQDIPVNPDESYKDWKGWKNWLGQYEKTPFISFEKAREKVRELGLKSSKEWKRYCNWDPNDIGLKPAEIPASPHVYYKEEGWKGYGDWLGTNRIASFQREYLPFEEARDFVRNLGLTSSELWVSYCKGELPHLPPKPDTIPTNISRKYRNLGWNGMDDFLNATYHRKMRRLHKARSFEAAREYVHSLNLKNLKEWIKFIKGELKGAPKKPNDIPNSPELVYKEFGWKGYGDWLGTYTIAPFKRKYRSFEEARDFARSLELTSSEKWIEYCKGEIKGLPKKPKDIPTNVSRKYKNEGWISYKDFLWSSIHRQKHSKFRPYEEAQAFIQSLNLPDYKAWKEYIGGLRKDLPKKPADIPANPAGVYKDKGWMGIGNWLGSNAFAYAHLEYRKFSEARKFVRTLGLTSSVEWVAYCKGELTHLPEKPIDIPANVVRKYENKGWKGFKDFLWSDKHRQARKKFMPYAEAQSFLQKNNIDSKKKLENFIKSDKKPENFPEFPQMAYSRKGWVNLETFLNFELV